MGVYRSIRHDMGLAPVPATGRPDACLITHTSVRAWGSGDVHLISATSTYAYVTRCGLTYAYTASVRCDATPSACCRIRKGPRPGLTYPEGP